MKKAILFAIFLSFSLLFFAKPAEAIYVKVTFNIDSVTVPVRALAADPACDRNTEMRINASNIKYQVLSGTTVIAEKNGPVNSLQKSIPGDVNYYPVSIVYNDRTGGNSYRIQLTSLGVTSVNTIECFPAGNSYYFSVYRTSDAKCFCKGGSVNMATPGKYLFFDF